MRIAIIGAGAAGLSAAWRLQARHDVTLFEADSRLGGHVHTVPVPRGEGTLAVDTGFIVYNERNYPRFTALLAELGVATQPSTMSFSFRAADRGLEYNPSSLATLFVQPRNLWSPRFHRMLRAILRFHREAAQLADQAPLDLTLGEWLDLWEYPDVFVEDFLTPMGAALWSIPRDAVLQMPLDFFLRFFAQHGMLAVRGRPQWRVIQGGSGRYVERLAAALRGTIRLGARVRQVLRESDRVLVDGEAFDQVVFACHSDDALGLLGDPTPAERDILGALPYQESTIQLHTDETLLPRRRRAWGAWNFLSRAGASGPPVVTYLMNALQGMPGPTQWCVSLNAEDLVHPDRVHFRTSYRHPRRTLAGGLAQRRRAEISGQGRTHYCGAYWGYGFHEDAVRSGLEVAQAIGAPG